MVVGLPSSGDRRHRLVVLAANTSWYISNFRRTLIEALLSDNDVVVLAQRDRYAGPLRALGCRVVHVPYVTGSPSLGGEIRTVVALARVFRKLKPDTILNFTSRTNLYSTLAAFGSDSVIVNNISGFGRAFPGGDRSGRLRPLARAVGLLYRVVGRRADHTFYQNRHDMAIGLERGFSSRAESSRLPGSGVDLSRFVFTPMPGSGPVHFVHIARLLPEKGVFDFIEAARRLRREFGSAVLFSIAGPDNGLGSEERERFEMELTNVGIEYHGMIDDVRPLLSRSHCMVLPSTYAEGVPRSLIEAAAMGRALVCYHNPGSEEIVRDGRTGWTVPAGDVRALFRTMRGVVEMGVARLAAVGRCAAEVARDEFDEKIVVRRYLEVIEACRGRRSRVTRGRGS